MKRFRIWRHFFGPRGSGSRTVSSPKDATSTTGVTASEVRGGKATPAAIMQSVGLSSNKQLQETNQTNPEMYRGLEHAPLLQERNILHGKRPPTVTAISIQVEGRPVGSQPAKQAIGFLHLPHGEMEGVEFSGYHPVKGVAAILLSGASGGVVGPSSIYLSIADKLASLRQGIPVLRLDYRYPAHTSSCVDDVLHAMSYLEAEYGIVRFVLVGWSFGGAPVFTVGGMATDTLGSREVLGCATIASQTVGTAGIRNVSPRPVLLLHGTGDERLSCSCSEMLYGMYGSDGDCTLKLLPGDSHSLVKYSLEAERLLYNFIMKCVGVPIYDEDQEGLVKVSGVPEEEKVNLMRKGHDVVEGGPERIS